MKNLILKLSMIVLFAAITTASAAPMFTLTDGTGAATASVTQGTAVATLNLHLNSDNLSFSGIFLHLEAPAPIKYAASPFTVGTPFSSADFVPTGGSAVDATQFTSFFSNAASDFSATSDSVLAVYRFDISGLSVGSYSFTPVGEGLSNNAGAAVTDFATPGVFTIKVTAVPEPAALSTIFVISAGLLKRRHR